MLLNSVSELDVVCVLLITFREVISGRLFFKQQKKSWTDSLELIWIKIFTFFQTLDTQGFLELLFVCQLIYQHDEISDWHSYLFAYYVCHNILLESLFFFLSWLCHRVWLLLCSRNSHPFLHWGWNITSPNAENLLRWKS